MASGMLVAVGPAVGLGVLVAAAGAGVAVARPPQAASRVKMISKKTSFVRTGFLHTRMRVFYLILKARTRFLEGNGFLRCRTDLRCIYLTATLMVLGRADSALAR